MTVSERKSFLDQGCTGNKALRDHLEKMLAAHDEDDSFLESPAIKGWPDSDFGAGPAEALVGRQFGRYRIESVIASGGMGTVYRAQQDNPRRAVALKIIKYGVVSRSALRRFQFEAQVLGRLQHPGIAQVFEAGTVGAGDDQQPFFAMELIEGEPLIRSAEQRNLSTRQRLELLAQLCEAVQHAHIKGVVHRDLKPANILVDSTGRPRILDFGVAKATDSDIQTTTLRTGIGQLIGTIPYMSPEQVSGDPQEVDARSDVYALGVVGYELLTGRLPYDLRHKTIPEAARLIREEDPTPLSAANRSLRGDLDTIVAKALEKDPERRYQSAAALAADFRRYLHDEPIVARPPSMLYQLRKFSRRNKALVGGIAIAFLALAAGATLAMWQAVRATQARDDYRTVLTTFTDMFTAVNPTELGRDVLVVDVLDRASGRIDEGLTDKPLIEAHLRNTIGVVYHNLGAIEDADNHLELALDIRERLLGKEHRDTLTSMNNLGKLYYTQGRYAEAESYFEETLAIRRRVLGVEDPDTLESMDNLAELHRRETRLPEAESLLVEALEVRFRVLGEKHRDTLSSMDGLGLLYCTQTEYEKAERLHVKALELRRQVLGEEDPDTLLSMNNLAGLYFDQGYYDKAAPLLELALELRRSKLGEDHPDTINSLNNLAVLYIDQGRYDEAEPLLVQALELRRRKQGDEHPDTLISMFTLAAFYQRQHRYEEAVELFEKVLLLAREVRPKRPAHLGKFLAGYGSCLSALQRYDEAEQILLEAHDILSAVFGTTHGRTIKVVRSLVDLYEAWGKPEQAAEYRALLPPPEDPPYDG